MFLPSDGLVASLVPAITASSAYSAGQVLGAPLEIAGATRETKGLSYLRTLLILDASNQKSAIDVLFFNQNPGNIGADGAALNLSAAQLLMMIGIVSVLTADYVTLKAATNAIATKVPNILIPAMQGSKSIWAAFVSRGTPTYGTVTDLTIKAILERQP